MIATLQILFTTATCATPYLIALTHGERVRYRTLRQADREHFTITHQRYGPTPPPTSSDTP